MHLLPAPEFRMVRTDRNRGKIDRPEQRRLLDRRIGVIGLSVGSASALTLAMEGIGGAYRLADFDTLSLSNLNRLRAAAHDVGVNKCVLAARQMYEIDPYLDIEIFPGGLTDEVMEGFFTARGGIDLLVEECDSPYVKLAARERARTLGIPVVMDANDRGLLDVERFDHEPQRPLLHGRLGPLRAADLAGELTFEQTVDLILAMVDADRIGPELTASIPLIGTAYSSWPQLASGVALGGALTADAARRILLDRPLLHRLRRPARPGTEHRLMTITALLEQPRLCHQTGDGLPVPFTVAGTGIHLPPAVITNAMLADVLDTTDEWIVTRTGIRERRRLAPDLATSDMALAAARPALEAAGAEAADIDAVIVASYTGDMPFPSTALIVKDALGAHRAMPLDFSQAACASGVQALLTAAHLLQNRSIGTVLLIAADCASRITHPNDRTAGVFFGDAAAAAVLTRTDTPGAGLLAYDVGSHLTYDVRIQADRLPECIDAAVRRAGLTMDTVDHFFLHQANINILREAMTVLGIDPAKAPVTLDRLGNTGAAGMFTALHHSVSEGRLKSGDTMVMSAIGAGFQWGALCLRQS
ncbi:3-oxoacyl-[acyl-carrier-protein] synthase III C-terminal domain-containing protein [Streptomyces sp. NPDC047461]|uniref:3-oxoacyl-[acyl-carrier-protein] synthase III C-terminal domain-containing protein n=1 Tax=Streptomyces sp. NPDC047461 TaxID=3155619 RepID=UPI0033CB70B6